MFAPTQLETSITPEEIDKAISCREYGRAINMALLLGDRSVLKRAIDAVAPSGIDLIQKSIDMFSMDFLMKFLAEEIVRNMYYFLYHNLLCMFSPILGT
jgi:hypothetical protein